MRRAASACRTCFFVRSIGVLVLEARPGSWVGAKGAAASGAWQAFRGKWATRSEGALPPQSLYPNSQHPHRMRVRAREGMRFPPVASHSAIGDTQALSGCCASHTKRRDAWGSVLAPPRDPSPGPHRSARLGRAPLPYRALGPVRRSGGRPWGEPEVSRFCPLSTKTGSPILKV